jgi:hypothetical protein
MAHKKLNRHTELVRACIAFIQLRGGLAVPVKNIGTPILRDGLRVGWRRGLIRPGVADIVGCTSTGRFLAVEVKTGKGRVTLEQAAFLNDVVTHGGLAVAVHDTVDALREVLDT